MNAQTDLFATPAPVTYDDDSLLNRPAFLVRPPRRALPDPKPEGWWMPDLAAMKAEREAKDARRGEIEAEKDQRAARKEQKRMDRIHVRRAIENGQDTCSQIQKATDIDAPRIKTAIRWLMKNERITKASAKRYAATK